MSIPLGEGKKLRQKKKTAEQLGGINSIHQDAGKGDPEFQALTGGGLRGIRNPSKLAKSWARAPNNSPTEGPERRTSVDSNHETEPQRQFHYQMITKFKVWKRNFLLW